MLLERADGTEIKPGEPVVESVALPKLGKRQTVFAYFERLTMEQAFSLVVCAKVSRTTPEGFIKTRLAKSGITVYPKGNAPRPDAAPAIGPDAPISYSMAAEQREIPDADGGL